LKNFAVEGTLDDSDAGFIGSIDRGGCAFSKSTEKPMIGLPQFCLSIQIEEELVAEMGEGSKGKGFYNFNHD
jgi:hypothetical protein